MKCPSEREISRKFNQLLTIIYNLKVPFRKKQKISNMIIKYVNMRVRSTAELYRQ